MKELIPELIMRQILREIKKLRSTEHPYGRDGFYHKQGFKACLGKVRVILDKYEPEITKKERAMSRQGRMKHNLESLEK